MTPALPESITSQFTDAERTLLIELRRSLHRRPELSWKESQTQARLREALLDIGITDIRETASTGLVAHIPGRSVSGPAVAIRGDIDALPIQEETGLPFTSMHAGVMHACGHDMHAAWAVGAGLLIAKQPAVGEVRVLLQPAEELGEGAPRVLTDGALEGVGAIFGGHVDWRFEVGQVVATPGPLAASTDTFEITFHGKGGHGARPQDTHDPIVGMAAFVSDVQTIVSRRLDPALPGVVTVGMLHAGSAPNVIPETATCGGTIRATTPESRALLVAEIERLAHAVAAAHRLTATVQVTQGTPPLMNSPRAAEWAQDAVRELLGDDALRKLPLANMGGEDFAFYTERIEGCFMRIGTWREGRERHGVHTPRFNPDEDSLLLASAVLAESARRASAALHSAA
ncbi:M20 family metallopeptidase [Pseudogemmatithrix spongiicola]|uniref:M20 family metallopeptidase n=1 Tax=Pseudogemmatithrix spongiicola TaxID=3062599 RepID=A0AA49JWR6_9BACT|nr:M20 family metallopeptidase [Gemmatimonadaceae bacterium 'strain 138']WKW16491.1 M20 family metallopeptidase [Gemmatimonadaceae bacterium 'strain 318']